MKKLLFWAITFAAFCIFSTGQASAEVINFDEFTINFQGSDPFTSGSLAFDSTTNLLGVWTSAPDTGEFNGTPYLLDGFSGVLTITRSDLQPFLLSSFDMAMGWYQTTTSLDMDVTYYLSGGGTVAASLPLTLSYQTFTPGLLVTQVDFDLNDFGYISMDNIVIDSQVVPEPSSILLIGTGLSVLGLAAFRRKKN